MANRNFITPGEVPKLSGNVRADVAALREFLVQLTAQLEYLLNILREQKND